MPSGQQRPLLLGSRWRQVLGGASLAAVFHVASGNASLDHPSSVLSLGSLAELPFGNDQASFSDDFLRRLDAASELNVSVVSDASEATAGTVPPASNKSGSSNRSHAVKPAPAKAPDRREGTEFDYHKPLFPLDWRHDGMTIAIAFFSLILAAGGGIGGGGILVPVYMLVLGFHPKHAVALSNITILGGSIANTLLNSRRKHPTRKDQPLIDWDLIIIMEPTTIFGAVFGSLMSKVLPNVILTVLLSLILGFMAQRTLKKGLEMWHKESLQQLEAKTNGSAAAGFESGPSSGASVTASEPIELVPQGGEEVEGSYLQLESDPETEGGGKSASNGAVADRQFKIMLLTLCFAGTCALTVMKGGGHLASPFGVECGSRSFWFLYFAALPWVMGFAVYFRHILLKEFHRKQAHKYQFSRGEIQWNNKNTIRYPAICTLSGIFAGLFGIGGGIVKGPLMLEMGVIPAVASASAAAMILYTSSAASASFAVFGLLHLSYGALFFVIGFVCTFVGQASLTSLLKKHKRESPIVLSIGFVIGLSSVLVGINTIARNFGVPLSMLFHPHGVCTVGAG